MAVIGRISPGELRHCTDWTNGCDIPDRLRLSAAYSKDDSMSTWYTHPDNVVWLRKHLTPAPDPAAPFPRVCSWGVDIRESPHMERMKETGRYFLPDGSCVAREDVRVETRFVSYGPEDVAHLIAVGAITAEMTRSFYEVEHSLFRVWMNQGVRPFPFSPITIGGM